MSGAFTGRGGGGSGGGVVQWGTSLHQLDGGQKHCSILLPSSVYSFFHKAFLTFSRSLRLVKICLQKFTKGEGKVIIFVGIGAS